MGDAETAKPDSVCYYRAMFWKLLTPDQWSALGTVVSAFIALLNLIVVVVLLRYTKAATESAQAQAAVALRTLAELDEQKKRENGRAFRVAEGELKDLGDALLVLETACHSTHFAADQWQAKPRNWHQITSAVIQCWPAGIQQTLALEQRLRAIDINLRCLASAPLMPEKYHDGKSHLQELVRETRPLAKEIWEGMVSALAQEP